MPILYHRRAAFLQSASVLLALLLMGCSESSGPVTIDRVAGTYRLHGVTRFSRMETLPIFVGESGGGVNFDTLVSGSLTLRTDKTFTVTRRFEDRTASGATLGSWEEITTGTFTLAAPSITFTTKAGDVVNGRADGGSVELAIAEGFHWFIR